MAELDEPTEAAEAAPDLAPNNWFAEYGMPYTTMMLESEAAYHEERPESSGTERHALAQFIIDQETAVARDYHEGRIGEAEFNQFKEMSEARMEELFDGVSKELDELGEAGEGWADDFSVALKEFKLEHNQEIDEIVAKGTVGNLSTDDVSLHVVADFMSVGLGNIDKLYEMMPPHLHDVLEVIETETLQTAHEMVDARTELSSAEAHDLEGARDELETIQPTFEAELDEVHEFIDVDFERIDVEIEQAKEFANTAQIHAEQNPDTTVEHMPYQIREDYDLTDQMEEDVGTDV